MKDLIIGLIIFIFLISIFGAIVSSDFYQVKAADKYISRWESCYFYVNDRTCVRGLEEGKLDCQSPVGLRDKYYRILGLPDIVECHQGEKYE